MAGMSTAQAVQSVTGWTAKSLEVYDMLGILELDQEAAIIVVDGNPRENINDLWNVADVFLSGRQVDRDSNK